MKKSICLLLILCGCDNARTWESPVMIEGATIVSVFHSPAMHGTTSGALGVTTNGDVTFDFGQSVNIPAVYCVTFKCDKHGTVFDIMGEEVYKTCAGHTRADLEYVEIIRQEVPSKNNPNPQPVVIDYHTKRVIIKNDR